MSVRRATATDAAWISALWTRAAPIWATFSPTRIQTAYAPDDALRDVESAGQRVYVEDGQRGMFICHPGFLPEKPGDDPARPPGGLAAQLSIWLARPGLPRQEYRELLHDLFAFWLRDEMVRGEFEYGFGEVPDALPRQSRDYLDDWGINVSEFERNDVLWRRYWYRIADAIERLP